MPPLFTSHAFVILSEAKDLTSRIALFNYHHLLHHIPLLDPINQIHITDHFSKNGMVAVEVGCVFAIMTDEELRSAGIATRMGHRQHATVMDLLGSGEFAWDFVAWSAGSGAKGTSALNHEIRNHAMENESVIESAFGEFDEIGDRSRRVVVVQVNI